MKAIVLTRFGDPTVFEMKDVPKPSPAANELLVRVHATSVNPLDYKIRRDGAWAGVKPPAIIGYDVSGIVEEIGEGVRDFKVGDEVYYAPEVFSGQGSHAEYHVANEAIVALKPSNLSHLEAASIPLAGSTAWDALVRRANLQIGESVLIHAGAGGVGSLAIQIAKAAGCIVFTTCGKYNFDLVQRLGAQLAIDYRSEDFVEVIRSETANKGVDVVLDTIGGETLYKSIEATKEFGRIVTINRSNVVGNLNMAYVKNVTMRFLFLRRGRGKLEDLRNLIELGKLKPVIDSIMPLQDVAEAHRKLEKGGVRGKIVLKLTNAPSVAFSDLLVP